MKQIDKNIEKIIVDYFNEKEEILFAYLHGSFMQGQSYNDIDIALFLDEDKTAYIDQVDYGINASIELEKKLRKTIDVKVLNGASLSFRYHATGGKLLFSKNELLREEFLCRTWMDYFDFQPFAIKYLKEVMRG
ncbi:MAG: hypothetical protein A2Y62_09420 [Candidatus Fischerbacteria bacterium RBG_13_37_8]|uniref:Polymerase beta nucleotidyltransferase domain-containing protein n=1 Tax=Candidatus Fischerbacteria bacterium RBG_13_37_8 TaxID=1817863 RepID=A0A1F5VUY3_9BACT|nr:MAG: hypothetical protein A2Y62_09420 [Candidatus Fischerbacteria bacterium RBG_13_37_8]